MNQGTYCCECGYTKTVQNTDESKGGIKTIVRLHSKVCPLVKSGVRSANPTATPQNFLLKPLYTEKQNQKTIHEDSKAIIADAKKRAFGVSN